MDTRLVFSDSALREEFLDRFDELTASGQDAGLESMAVPDVDRASDVVKDMSEGVFTPGSQPELEAIVERFTRPVYLVQRGTFAAPDDTFPNSVEIGGRLADAKDVLDAAIPSIGRIDLRNSRLAWVGTGWVVAPEIVVTNRHVALTFATREGQGFAFAKNFMYPSTKAFLDWRHEHAQPEESRFRVKEVLWIEPDDSVDVAVLRISSEGEDGEPVPPPLELMEDSELGATAVGGWVGVIGYPAQDSRNNGADQQRIFDGIFNVKRLAPGRITSLMGTDLIDHDATTLGGNSGSALVDLMTGKAVGLHFGGVEGEGNHAVQSPRVARVLRPFLG